MNKKFLSAIMCGAMLTASTSVFVSCEDYGDDIAHLQEQIDQNATTSASELAAKVAALESQISTLKTAQESMKEQLASAKAEAAAAANTALSAAQAAQAAADAAQSGAEDAKAAAAAAQAAADAANKTLSDAIARVAVLETKVASLESVIAQLTASDKELTSKLNDLQVLANSLSNTSSANAEEIKAIKSDLAAKTAELSGQIAKVSAELGAKIDAIDAELNTIKENYATKKELNEKAAELAAADAKLAEQIAANEAYIKGMQDAIEALQEKDAETAETIAAQQAAAVAEIAKINEALAAQKEAVAEELEAVNAQLADLEATVAQLAQLAAGNYNDIATIREYLDNKVTEIENILSELIKMDLTLYNDLAKHLEEIARLDGSVADLDEQVSQLIKQSGSVQEDLANILVAIYDLDEENAAQNKLIEQLAAQIAENHTAVADFVTVLEADVKALQDWTVAYEAKYAEFVKAQEEAIAAELAKLENVSEGLLAAQANIETLMGQVDGIINGLHSVVFVPAYSNLDFDLSVYHINTWVKGANNTIVAGNDVFPVSTAKFRVEPTGFADKLAEAYAQDNSILKIESANKLVTTRSEAQSLLKIESVKAVGDYLYVGVSKVGQTTDVTHPTTLVVANTDSTLSKTSDFFNVKFATEAEGAIVNGLVATGNGKGASFNSYTEGTRTALDESSKATVNLYHNVFDAYNVKEALTTNLFNAVATVTLPYDGVIESNLRIVSVDDQALTNGVWSNTYFTVKENGEVTVNSNNGIAIANNVGQKIVVKVVDDTYELFSNGEAYVEYDITFAIVENLYENTLTFNYAMTWPDITAAAQEITLATIAADATGLANYKLTAADVFNSLYNMVGTTGKTYNLGALGITMVAVPATQAKEAHITVTPSVTLAHNYNEDVNNWLATSFKDNALCSLIKINVNFDFSVPGVADFFNKIKMYWGGENDNTLEVDYTLKESETNSEYTYEVDMNQVYLFEDWTPGVVDYSWSVDKADNVLSYSNIEFSNEGKLIINGPISILYTDGTTKDSVNVADLTFTATAANNGNVLVKQTAQKFNVTYPIDAKQIQKPNNVVFKYSDLKAGKKFDATSAVSLKDIDGYTWIHEGAILASDADGLTSVASAWVIENLKYEVINVTSEEQDLTAEQLITIEPAGGELKINKPANITKKAEVTIKMSFDYKYEKGVYTTYTVIVDPAL